MNRLASMQASPLPAGERSLNATEFALLCLLAFFLPLAEAPKNVLWLVLVLVWLGRSLALRQWGPAMAGWNWVLWGVPMAAFASVALSSPFPSNWQEAADGLRYVPLAWIVARSRLTDRQLTVLLATLLGATFLGLAHGYWLWAIEGRKQYLELHSVGHVNHSAVYVVGIALATLAATAALWRRLGPAPRAAALLVNLALLAVLLSWESRGAALTYCAGFLLFAAHYSRSRAVSPWPMAAAALAAAAVILTVQPYLITKTMAHLARDTGVSSYRVELARTAMETFLHAPFSGVGPGNFGAVAPAVVQDWTTGRGVAYKPLRYFFSGHAHSLYFNTLAERGLLGSAALLALLYAWTRTLYRQRPGAASPPRRWVGWGIGLAGWSMTFLGGLFNTTLHHEHAMLAMLFLGVLLGTTPGPWGTPIASR